MLFAIPRPPFARSHQSWFKLPTDHGFDAEPAQQVGIQGSVQTVADQARAGVELLHSLDHRHRQPCRRVHRQIEGDQVRGANRSFFQGSYRQVQTHHVVVLASQPGRG